MKENRKEEIFAAAVKCFNQNGYYKTSMDMIAESAKMTKRGLYYHFTLNANFNLAEQHSFNILHLLKGLKNGRPSQ